MVKVVRIVQPSEAELGKDIERQVPCPVPGCGKVFQHSAALTMHTVKVHKIIQSDANLQLYSKGSSKEDKVEQYHCPVKMCKYQTGFLFFSTYSNLRQHYLKVHAEKRFKCELCGVGFGMERLLRMHSTRCNLIFKCSVCSRQFGDKSSLEKHCQATSHPFMFTASDLQTNVMQKGIATQVQGAGAEQSSSLLNVEALTNSTEVPCRTDSIHSGTSVEKHEGTPSDTVDLVHNILDPGPLSNGPHMRLQYGKYESQTAGCSKDNNSQCISFTAGSLQTTNQAKSMVLSGQQKLLPTKKVLHSVTKSNCAVISNVQKSTKVELTKQNSNIYSPFQPKQQALDLSCRQVNSLADMSLANNTNPKILPTLMPKISPQPILVISPSSGGNITLVNQNITVYPKPRDILPKVSLPQQKPPCPTSQLARVSQFAAIKNTTNTEKRSNTTRKRESSGTQTLSPRKRICWAAAETQTTGDYILKKAMRSANLPIIKQSKGSQVSPRAKLKRKAPSQTACSHTQTAAASSPDQKKKATVNRTHLCAQTPPVSLSMQSSQTNEQVAKRTAIETQTSLTSEQEAQTQIAPTIETQTYPSAGLMPLITSTPSDSMKPVESISTQTAHTYQYKNLPTQDSQIQTKLSMNMSLAACDSMDLQCLQELGIASGITSEDAPLPGNLFCGNRDSLGAMAAQADTAIDRKLAELESSSKGQLTDHNLALGHPLSQEIPYITNSVSVQTATDPLENCQNILPTAEMQVQTSVEDFDLPAFLSTEVQTTNFEQMYSNSIETQTAADDVFSDLLSHMETQTNEEDLSWMDLGFTDIQTQTTSQGHPLSQPLAAVHVQTQTSIDQRHHVQIQAGLLDVPSLSMRSADTETQTLFDMNLTDSHTQTSWNDLLKIVKELN